MVERINMQCPECGGEIVLTDDRKFGKCSSCENEFAYKCEKSSEKIGLLNHANLLRMRGDFEGALVAYQSLVDIDANDAEVYWGMVLSTYGIEYVLDPRTNRHLPTCRRIAGKSIFSDKNYKLTLQLCDDEQRNKYQREAVLIDNLQSDIKERLSKEQEYDVFICFKSTDEDGLATEDRYVGRRIYDELTKRGVRTFFSEVSLKDKLGRDFEPIIYKALYSAKVMILVATNEQYINSVWLRNEWARFRDRVREENLKDASFAVFKNISKNALPPLFRSQGVDLAKYPFGGYEFEIADALSLRLQNSSDPFTAKANFNCGSDFGTVGTKTGSTNSDNYFYSNTKNSDSSGSYSYGNAKSSDSSGSDSGNAHDSSAERVQKNLTREQVNKQLSILVKERNHYTKLKERAESEQNMTKAAMKRTAERRKVFALEKEKLENTLSDPNYLRKQNTKKTTGSVLFSIIFTIILISVTSTWIQLIPFRILLIIIGLSVIWGGHLARNNRKNLEKKKLIDTEREAQLREQIIQCETHLANQNRKLEKCLESISDASQKLREREQMLAEYVRTYDYAAAQIEKINSSIGQKVASAISDGVIELSNGIDKGISAVKDAFRKS